MYTDFVDQPIHEGDEIVYAQSAYGGGAQLHRATIHKLIPLIPHRDGRADRFMREDQARKASCTEFRGEQYNDPSKRFVIQVMRKKWVGTRRTGSDNPYQEQRYTIPHSNHVIRVPS
jgi:hypothetical protein